ncbi:hypothetical protein JTE90_019546 [Oedothorax gibbosus]|uniref:Integrase catalytic domain-containing protein n=1 Tax=Oedothorax gibbosus TaxID=931172 RepID=A0AAV6U8H4_9ARAC|nr:hypothetical protein JTE90_019546 [Oedothorax gibbosus]
MKATTICQAVFSGWISRFGCPAVITTDQGSQMRSSLYREFSNTLGTNRIQTTAYHPIANVLVERFHRHLKSSIKAHESFRWTDILPIVLLGIRTAVKGDIGASCAEVMYGMTLKLPCDMIDTSKTQFGNAEFVNQLRTAMWDLNPVATSAHGSVRTYVNPSMKTCTHVFLRVDSVRPPLRQPYTGPHKIVERSNKTVCIELKGKKSTVSIDRVKPAYLMSDGAVQLTDKNIPSNKDTLLGDSGRDRVIVTRSGRRVHFPKHLATIIS